MIENARRQLLLVLLTIVLGITCTLTLKVPLGPDLKGGTQLLYEVPADVLEQMRVKENVPLDTIMDQTIAVIGERIDPTGALDPLITRSGETGILIELPYFEDKQELRRVLERIENLGKLEMRLVAHRDFVDGPVQFNLQAEKSRLEAWLARPENKELIDKDPRNIRQFNEDSVSGPLQFGNLAWYPRQIRPSFEDPNLWDRPFTSIPSLADATLKAYDDARWNSGVVPEEVKKLDKKDQFLIEFVALNMKERHFSGEDLDPSGVGVGPSQRGGLGVNYAIVPALADVYAEWSGNNIGRSSAIVLNGFVKSAPVFESKIPGRGIISGDFTREEVEELVKVLRTGSLRVEPELQSRQEIGPTLGAAAIQRGVISLLAGSAMVFLFVLYYYRIAGTIACITLILNVFLLYAAMLFMQATITLPGLGGIVLTLGMAVDANVLIYERIREEMRRGKALLQAVRAGFERAMSAILDSNITTFLVGIVLFNVGVGPVRGFAVTLMVGIVTTVFTQFFVTRLLFHYAIERKLLEAWKPRTLFETTNFDFIKHLGKCIAASAVLIVAGVSYAFLVAPREVTLGIDFTGGANLQMVVAEPMTADEVRARLNADSAFKQAYPNAAINTIGDVASGGLVTRFNVRLKLDDRQREAIDASRRAWRETRDAAERAGLPPPPAYEPPYQLDLRRVFADRLVQPAFSDALTTEHADRKNLLYAQINVHFQKPVLLAEARDLLGRGLPQSNLTPLPDEDATEAKDLRIEWTTQATTKAWELAGIVSQLIEDLKLKDVTGNDILLSEPFPEAQEIQGRLVNDLRNAAIGALVIAWVLIVLYLRVRFHEYKYGVAAVVALIHDVLMTFGVVVFVNHMGWVHAEINLAMIACFLTVIGYSVNDTIVVFDRIRENRVDNARTGAAEPFRALINRSLNQTLSRTVLTTLLTLLVVIAQFLVNWGSDSDLESFAFAMIIGMMSGVYSTIYIAAPVLIWMDKGSAKPSDEPVKAPVAART